MLILEYNYQDCELCVHYMKLAWRKVLIWTVHYYHRYFKNLHVGIFFFLIIFFLFLSYCSIGGVVFSFWLLFFLFLRDCSFRKCCIVTPVTLQNFLMICFDDVSGYRTWLCYFHLQTNREVSAIITMILSAVNRTCLLCLVVILITFFKVEIVIG